MSRLFRNLSLSVFFILSALSLTACGIPGTVVGLGASAGGMVLEERGLEQSAIDKKTMLVIIDKFTKDPEKRFKGLVVDVIEGQVFLTGTVKSQADRIEATVRAWEAEDVVNVFNEAIIQDKESFTDFSKDLTIESKLATILTFDKQVLALNYESSVVNGTVYLFGIAQNQAELDQVIAQAKDISHVRRVVSFVRMKNDPERLAWLEKQKNKE